MEKGDKKQKIKWDEVTIAEHDKERGTRQKIDEAPTPFRYQSESDQSECESSDAEGLMKRSEDEGDEPSPVPGTPGQKSGKKKKNVIFNNNSSKICDSWQAVNAKLQYEKHLQDALAAGNMQPLNGEFSNSTLRREFYQHRGSSSDGNIASQGYERGSPKVSLGSTGKIQDLQTSFGEVLNAAVHPAPAAFSPQFTRKDYRSPTKGNRGHVTLSIASVEGEADSESEDEEETRSTDPSSSQTFGNGTGHHPSAERIERIPKTVFIRSQSDPQGIEGKVASAAEYRDSSHDAGYGAAGSGDESDATKQKFLNKRAGHYNEFKVLQAMRAKMAASADDDDDEDD